MLTGLDSSTSEAKFHEARKNSETMPYMNVPIRYLLHLPSRSRMKKRDLFFFRCCTPFGLFDRWFGRARPLLLLHDDRHQALGVLNVDGLDVAVELLLGILLVVSSAADADA